MLQVPRKEAFMPENPPIWFNTLELSFDIGGVEAGHKFAHTVTRGPRGTENIRDTER